jgi:uncharacterized repeat protein (TIGR03803 family)
MKKSSAWKMICILLMFCAAAVIASPAQTLTTLYSFCSQHNCADGEYPLGRLVQGTDGNFYGTTFQQGGGGYGTVYKVTSSGTLTILHNLTGQSDGGNPYAGVIQATDGNFYGVDTIGGGTPSGCGAVYKVAPNGTTTILYDFTGYYHNRDGCSPWLPLVQASDGNFYGTTNSGGTSNVGSVFKITPGGTLTILYNFCTQSGCPDGANPFAGLIQANDGNLYGVASIGGAYNYGSVFKITTSGTLTTLHSFNSTDGNTPDGGLVQASDGNFYGTTYGGGANNDGTVFKMTPSGTLTTLYSFCSQPSCTDGNGPYAGLLQGRDGNFYGTTYLGGNWVQGNTYGTVFSITPSGTLTTLYSFCSQANCADGARPYAGLIQASNGNLYGTTKQGGTNNSGTVFELQLPPTLAVSTFGDGTVTSTDGFIHCPGTCSHTYAYGTPVTLNATPGQGWVFGGWNGACAGTSSCSVTMTQPLSVDAIFSQALQFVAATPCRLVDTRPQHGGSGSIQGGTFQSFPIPQEGDCNIPDTAAAYSLNVTVVPQGPLGYLTIWPTGEYQPVVSTLNSVDGRVKADAAIVPAGAYGAVSVYVTNTTDVILDIDGYFAPVSSSTLAFYPLPPCRVVDTRVATFPTGLGPPQLFAATPRDFSVLNSPCIPSGINPAAYSFNFTVVPGGHPVGYLSAWPTGQSQPVVSTLNDQTGTIVANAAIVPAGTSGNISVYSTNDTQLLIDINGYFAPAGPGGLSLYPVAPCRVIDTRHGGSGQPFSGTLTPPVDVVDSACEPPAAAQAYVFNATVVPTGALGYLTLWPDGTDQPVVSTLNAFDGALTNNMAIVPSTNGKVDAYANGLTQLILDISSYFAP